MWFRERRITLNEKPPRMDTLRQALFAGGDVAHPFRTLGHYARRTLSELVGGRKPTLRNLILVSCVITALVLSLIGTYRAIGGQRSISMSVSSFSRLGDGSRDQGSAPDKVVVLASYDGQRTDWVHTIPHDWRINRFVLEGREAYTYLSFIIDNYNSLPKYTVFLHGHQTAWHQIEPTAWKIRALNLTSLERQGYINLRCTHDSGCTDDTILGSGHPWIEFKPLRDILGNMMVSFWATYMQPYEFGIYPEELGQPCCAQFAVTREAILAHPLQFYQHFRSPLEWSAEHGRAIFGFNWDKYHAGTLYEYLWHVVFGQEAKYCPSEEVCRKEYFSDAIACEKYPGRYQSAFGWRNINCSSIYEMEQEEEGVSRVTIEEFWGRPDPESETSN